MSAGVLSRTQSVYNTGGDNTDAKPFDPTDKPTSITDTGSDDPAGETNGQNMAKEGVKAGTSANPNIGKQGFGA